MSRNCFDIAVSDCAASLQSEKKLGRLGALLTLGLFRNRKRIAMSEKSYRKALEQLRQYRQLLREAEALDGKLETLDLAGVRVTTCVFSDISVVNPEEYGDNWQELRDMVLTRDNHECQEADSWCDGPLQIHHRHPISKGGTNELGNLVTLCLYHHTLKHPHMMERIYGSLWG